MSLVRLGGKRGAGVRGPGSKGVENAGCGKHGVWWKTRGLSGKHEGNNFPH